MNVLNVLTRVARRFRLLFYKPEVEQELTDEVRLHVDLEAEDLVRGGWAASDAHWEAYRRLGGVERTKELVRDARGGRFVDDLLQDIRYAQRSLTKDRGFTFVAVTILALGIGANTAVYSVVSRVLLEPLPFREPNRLVAVWETNFPERPRTFVSPGTYLDWRDRGTVFEGLEAFAVTPSFFNTVTGGQPVRLQGRMVTVGLLPMLGVTPAIGRAFLPEESVRGAGQVVLLSDGLWQRLFNRDAAALGRSLPLNDQSYTVIGVLPPSFSFPTPETDFWIPATFSDASRDVRTSRPFEVIGRLAPGMSLEQARTEMATIAAQMQQARPALRGWDVGMGQLLESMTADVRPALLILAGAVGLVLLIACTNVANMLLVRATVRQREMALRAALGASRRRILQQLLTESVALASVAGALGLIVAWGLVTAFPAIIAVDVPRLTDLRLDARAAWFTAAVTLMTAITFGLAPAWQGVRGAPTAAIAEGGRGTPGRRSQRLRAALVVGQIAGAVVLLVGAGLLIRSFARLVEVDPGFDSRDVLIGRVDLSGVREAADQRVFFETLIDRLELLPGVSDVGASQVLPLYGDYGVPFYLDGRPRPDPGQMPTSRYYAVTPGYFSAMGIALVSGRLFTERDSADAPGALIISEELARRHFPNEDPIGRSVHYTNGLGPMRAKQIVGVVRNTLHSGLDADAAPQMYDPFAQSPFPTMALVLRARGAQAGLAATLRREVQSLKPDQPISSIEWMTSVINASVGRERFLTSLLSAFAGVALLLAAIGIYGLLAYGVAQRRREIAVRVALGASRAAVVRLVLLDGATLCGIGVVLGLLTALALTRTLGAVLFQISATDPVAFTAVPIVLAVVALVAIYVPARRVTQIDPMTALRAE